MWGPIVTKSLWVVVERQIVISEFNDDYFKTIYTSISGKR